MSKLPNDRSLTIEYVSSAQLRPDPNNPRTHSKKQITQIAASMTAFGVVNPMLADEDWVLIAGQGRLQAAKSLGHEFVPVIRLTGLSQAQKKALRIADNKIASNSGWDADLLRQQVIEIQSMEIEFDVQVMGFETAELDLMMAPPAVAVSDDDCLPETAAVARAQLGDIWALGRHRIGCGDCRDPDFLQAVVGPDTKVDAAFLDPPYNVSIQHHANIRTAHREFAMASGEMTDRQAATASTPFSTMCGLMPVWLSSKART